MVLRTRIAAAMLEPTFRSIHKHKLYRYMYHTEFKIVINETDNVDYFKKKLEKLVFIYSRNKFLLR